MLRHQRNVCQWYRSNGKVATKQHQRVFVTWDWDRVRINSLLLRFHVIFSVVASLTNKTLFPPGDEKKKKTGVPLISFPLPTFLYPSPPPCFFPAQILLVFSQTLLRQKKSSCRFAITVLPFLSTNLVANFFQGVSVHHHIAIRAITLHECECT